MVFSRTTGDSGPQEWRRTCQQTSCLLLLVEVATRNSTHPAHAWVLKLPFQTPSSPHPQAALCWFSPDAAQGPPKTGSGLGVRVFGVKWDEEKKKDRQGDFSGVSSPNCFPYPGSLPLRSPLPPPAQVSPSLAARAGSLPCCVCTTGHTEHHLFPFSSFCFWS